VFRNDSQVNPHPVLDERRLAQISNETLRDMIRLHCGAGIPQDRLALAGIPAVNDITIELMRRNADPPVIPVIPARGREAWLLSFECPWCPKRRGKPRTHTHGGGWINEPPEGGHRVSHCYAEGAPDGYFLVVVEAESAVQR
jgi:hypothetical protein